MRTCTYAATRLAVTQTKADLQDITPCKEQRTMPEPIVESFAVPPLGCNCTIIGDPETKDACVVDPGGDVSRILARLESHGLTLKR